MTHITKIQKKYSPSLIRLCLLFAIALTLAIPASAEWKEKVLYSFQGGAEVGRCPQAEWFSTSRAISTGSRKMAVRIRAVRQ